MGAKGGGERGDGAVRARRAGLLGILLGCACGTPETDPGAGGSASDSPGGALPEVDIAFANLCTATGPDVELVTPAEAAAWIESERPYCVAFEDTPEYHGGFDPLGLEAPCGAGDAVSPWKSSKDLYPIVTATGAASYTLHVGTRIEETDDDRCVGCYPEESECAGTTSIRELSRDVSLATPEGGGSRVVPLTEIQGLDFEHQVLCLVLAVELMAGDSVVARDTLAPDWALCC